MGKHLVLVGGGHAHLTVLRQLDRFIAPGHRVTVISADAFHYYSGMGPGMLAGTYTPGEIRFHIRKMAEEREGHFIENQVVHVDPAHRTLCLKGGDEMGYDVASFNVGSQIPFEMSAHTPNTNVFPVKPIENLLKARHVIAERLKSGPVRLCVAGGGPAGVEIAANLHRLVQSRGGKADITLVAGPRLLSRMGEKARQAALKALEAMGIRVMEGKRLISVQEGQAGLSDGSALKADVILLAVGTVPPALFRDSGLPTGPDGGLRVSEYLQCPAYPRLFGGGDCIAFGPRPLAKVGVYAVRQNPVLCHNLLTALEGSQAYKKFVPQKSFMLILNMGDGTGIFIRENQVWRGKLAFWLKNHIDTRFMRKFQVSGERG